MIVPVHIGEKEEYVQPKEGYISEYATHHQQELLKNILDAALIHNSQSVKQMENDIEVFNAYAKRHTWMPVMTEQLNILLQSSKSMVKTTDSLKLEEAKLTEIDNDITARAAYLDKVTMDAMFFIPDVYKSLYKSASLQDREVMIKEVLKDARNKHESIRSSMLSKTTKLDTKAEKAYNKYYKLVDKINRGKTVKPKELKKAKTKYEAMASKAKEFDKSTSMNEMNMVSKSVLTMEGMLDDIRDKKDAIYALQTLKADYKRKELPYQAAFLNNFVDTYNSVASVINPNVHNRMLTAPEIGNLDMYHKKDQPDTEIALQVIYNNDISPITAILTAAAFKSARLPIPPNLMFIIQAMHKLGVYGSDVNRKLYMSYNASRIDEDIEASRRLLNDSWADMRMNGVVALLPHFNNSEFNTLKQAMQTEGSIASLNIRALWSTRSPETQQSIRNFMTSEINRIQTVLNGFTRLDGWTQLSPVNLWDTEHDIPSIPKTGHFTIAVQNYELYDMFGRYALEQKPPTNDVKLLMISQIEQLMRTIASKPYVNNLSLVMIHSHIISQGRDESHPQAMTVSDLLENLNYVLNVLINGDANTFIINTYASGNNQLERGRLDSTHGSDPSQDLDIEMRVVNPFYLGLYFIVTRPPMKPHKAANKICGFLRLSCPESHDDDCLIQALLAREPKPTEEEIKLIDMNKCNNLHIVLATSIKSFQWVVVMMIYSDNTWLLKSSDESLLSMKPTEFDKLANVRVLYNRRGHVWNVDGVELTPKRRSFIYKQHGRCIIMKDKTPCEGCLGVPELLIGNNYAASHILCMDNVMSMLACKDLKNSYNKSALDDPLTYMNRDEFIIPYISSNSDLFKYNRDKYSSLIPNGIIKQDTSKWQQGVKEERDNNIYSSYSISAIVPRHIILTDENNLSINRCSQYGLPENVDASYLKNNLYNLVILIRLKKSWWRVIDILDPNEQIYSTIKVYREDNIKNTLSSLYDKGLIPKEDLPIQNNSDEEYVKQLKTQSVIITSFRHGYGSTNISYSYNTLPDPKKALRCSFSNGYRFFEREHLLYYIVNGHTWYTVQTKFMTEDKHIMPIYGAFDFETANSVPSKEYFRQVYKTVPVICHFCYVVTGYDTKESEIKYKQFEGPMCNHYIISFLKQLEDEEGRPIHMVGFNNCTFDNHLITHPLSSIYSWGSHKNDNCLLVHGAKLNSITAGRLTIHDMRNITLGSLDSAARDNKVGACKTIWDHKKTQAMFESSGCDVYNLLERMKTMKATEFIPKPQYNSKWAASSKQVREYNNMMKNYNDLIEDYKDSNAYDAYHSYCKNDVKVTLLLFLRMGSIVEKMSNGILLQNVSTLSELTWKIFKNNLPIEDGKKIELPRILTEELYAEIHKWLVVGGRSEVTDDAPYCLINKAFQRFLSAILDVTSLYPYVGLVGTFPDGEYRKVLPDEDLPIKDCIGIYMITITKQANPCLIPIKSTHPAFIIDGVEHKVGSNCFDYPAGIDGHGTYNAMVFGEDIIVHRMNGGECTIHYGYVWNKMRSNFFHKIWYMYRDGKMNQDRLREEDAIEADRIAKANVLHLLNNEPIEEFIPKYNATERNIFKIISNALFGKTCERPPDQKVAVARGSMIDKKLNDHNKGDTIITDEQIIKAFDKKTVSLEEPEAKEITKPKTFIMPLVACTDNMSATQQLISKRETHLIITRMTLADYFEDERLRNKIKSIILGARILCLSRLHMYSAAISRFHHLGMRMAQETDSEHLKDINKYEDQFIINNHPTSDPWNQPPIWSKMNGLYNCTLFRWLLHTEPYDEEHKALVPLGSLCVPELMREWKKRFNTNEEIPSPDYGQFKLEGQVKERDVIYIAKKMYHEQCTEDNVDKDRAKGVGSHSILADEIMKYDETMKFYRLPYNKDEVRNKISELISNASPAMSIDLFNKLGSGQAVDICDFLFGGSISKAKQSYARGSTSDFDAFGLLYSLPIKRILPSKQFRLVLRCDEQTDIEKWITSLPPRTKPSETNKITAYRYRTKLNDEDITNIIRYIDAHLSNPIEMRGFNIDTSAGYTYVNEIEIRFIYVHRKYFYDIMHIDMDVFNESVKYIRSLQGIRTQVESGSISIDDATKLLHLSDTSTSVN